MIRRVPRDLGPKNREEHEVEFSRIVAFSDGVFSIAITLLVLDLALKDGLLTDKAIWQELWDQHEQFLAYAISFAVIARFWIVHHGFFSEVKAFNTRLIGLNMLYLGFIVLIPFSSQVLGEYGGTLPAVVVYSVNLAAVILVGQWMRWDARRAQLTTTDAETAREDFLTSIFIACVFLLSIVIALSSPSLAPWIWLALFFEGRGHVIERVNRRLS
jgi:uncharacterized membrane protein